MSYVLQIGSVLYYLLTVRASTQLFNRILAPYVENLDLNQVNYGIGQGIPNMFHLKSIY